jgi:signal transduction histidine kinase
MVLAAMVLIALLALATVSDRSARVVARSVDTLDQHRDVLVSVDRLRAELAGAESAARGYALTGDAAFGADFERGIESVRRSLATLEMHARHAPRQRGSLAALDGLVGQRLDLFRNLLALQRRRAPQAEVRVNLIQGTAVSRSIGRVLEAVRAEEVRYFTRQTEKVETSWRYAMYAPWAMCLIAVILFVSMVAQGEAMLRRGRLLREELRNAALQELAARERVQEADLLKNQFLATVSHELRTPLTSIIGWCGLLGDEKLRVTLLDEGLTTIAQAARVQSLLVEDLLDVSRIVAGRLKLTLLPVDAASVVDQAIASVEPSARAKNIAVSRSFEGTGFSLVADPVRLQQIVWNLLSNAIKFTPDGGSIEVTLRPAGASLRITVRDTGEGIAPELLPHIFERFRQGNATGARAAGLGLGLTIVNSLVQLHGGSIRAESAGLGTGATFTVELPISGPAECVAAAAVPSPLEPLPPHRGLLTLRDAELL